MTIDCAHYHLLVDEIQNNNKFSTPIEPEYVYSRVTRKFLAYKIISDTGERTKAKILVMLG